MVSALSRRFGLPTPIVLVIAGILVSLIPGLPEYRLDPELVLVGFLPPLLYAESLGTSLRDLRTNPRTARVRRLGMTGFVPNQSDARPFTSLIEKPLEPASLVTFVRHALAPVSMRLPAGRG